jgi:hypothetical protein
MRGKGIGLEASYNDDDGYSLLLLLLLVLLLLLHVLLLLLQPSTAAAARCHCALLCLRPSAVLLLCVVSVLGK